MEVLFKKYFWIANLAVIALCATFAGRAAAHLVEAKYLVGELPPARLHVRGAKERPAHAKDGAAIIKRNVFCSGCAPIEEATPTPAEEQAHRDEAQKTSLQLELVSTMLCPSDERWSMAVLRDLSTKEKDPTMVTRDSEFAGLRVTRIDLRRVYFRNHGQLEYVELEEPAHAGPKPPAAAPSTVDPALGDIDRGVACTGNACTIERAVVEKLLSNTMALATAARFVPSIKDGKPNGFKLYAIRPNSIFAKIGLQNGDTIKSINGNEMTTPDAALALYSKLRSASHLSAQVERRNELVTLDYTIR